ncbi:MAG: aspartate aminotransferase family protein [Pseudanabaenaceae cyanobacterium bins.39]|nr:aspartate aminotransferase family protein [Pseudanabaenaceae cyanobacterium bins.39]
MSPTTLEAQSPPQIDNHVTPDAIAEFNQYVMSTYARFPIALERGEGCLVWDSNGKEYLDFVAGIATCTLGHAHPAMVKAVTEQIQTLHHASNLFYFAPQGQLAKWLVQNSCADKAFFCNSGAEANEGAIKLARKYAHTKLGITDPVILTANASFHGRTLATVTATGQPKYHKNFAPLVSGFDYIPYNDLTALEAAVSKYEGRLAAIMLEPLQGEGGVNPGDRAYFSRIREICDEKKILLIIDEVQVGMGRSGMLWGYENLGIQPDVFTSAKGLGGGIPIGAMLCKAHCDVFEPGDHASTFGGNPFACAVALAVCHTMVEQNLIANARERGQQLRTGLQALCDRYPQHLASVRGWGLIDGLVLQESSSIQARDVVAAGIDNGLLLVPAGVKVVRFVPPLTVSATEIDKALAIVEKAIAAIVA